MKNPVYVCALSTDQLRTDLLNSVTIPDKLPSAIQWMPPGVHKICPYIGGEPKPITIAVNKELADQLDAELQKMRRDAANHQGDVPYLDFNHDDAEASAEVLSLEWRGDDISTGGIWANVKWTAAGKAALGGGNYRRFSPQWLTDADTNEPVGIGVNLGGLVNRAAFKNIRPVMAKAGIARGFPGESDLTVMAKQYAEKNGIPLSCAYETLARDENLYRNYRRSLGLIQ
jgi:hypothetical protein